MADLYNFTDDEYCIIDFLKKFVVIKYGNFRSFKLKKEKDKYYKIITLYAPRLYNENTIDAYLLKNAYNIYKMGYKCNFPKINLLPESHNYMLYLGNVYKILHNQLLDKPYYIDNTNNIITSKYNLNIKENQDLFYKKQAAIVLQERLYQYAEKFNLNVKNVKIRFYKSMWGACCSNKTIMLNEKLILSPIYTIDAVICHELAHMLQPNHSKDFYQTLENMYPDYYKDYIWLNIYMKI